MATVIIVGEAPSDSVSRRLFDRRVEPARHSRRGRDGDWRRGGDYIQLVATRRATRRRRPWASGEFFVLIGGEAGAGML